MATLYKFGKRQRNGDSCNLKTVWSSSPRPAEALIGISLEKREDTEQSAKLFFSVDEALSLERQLHRLRYYHLAALHGLDHEVADHIATHNLIKAASTLRKNSDNSITFMQIRSRIETFVEDWKKLNAWKIELNATISSMKENSNG